MKMCKRCRKARPFRQFSLKRSSPDGCQSWCKRCFRKYAHEYRKRNLLRLRRRERDYSRTRRVTTLQQQLNTKRRHPSQSRKRRQQQRASSAIHDASERFERHIAGVNKRPPTGRMMIPDRYCHVCGESGPVLRYYWRGYRSEADRLAAIPLCRKHHDEVHVDIREAEAKGQDRFEGFRAFMLRYGFGGKYINNT